MTLTKDVIVDTLVKEYGMGRREMIDIVDTFFDEIKHKIAAGERATFYGFGTFYKKKQSYKRKRRTIKVQEDEDNWHTISFRPARLLQARVQRASVEEARDVD